MHPIQAELNRLVEAGVPGAFAYLEDRDGASRCFTAGWADVAMRQRMTPGSHYRVGSTTKTFTAVVLLQLVAEGKLALHDTLEERLPDLAIPNAHFLTVEHLLRMRSGLFDFEDDASLAGNLDAHLTPWSLADVIWLGIRQPAAFPPGARFSYCNTNFCLLELIIERLTGHSLGDELAQRILGPLGMAGASYPAADDLTLPEPYIRGYERTQAGWRECSQVFFGRGDGALLSTAPDLARFFRALLLDQALLPDGLLSQVMAVVRDDPPAEEAYGLGLIADPLPCGTVWGHGGGGYGYVHLPYLRLETGRFAVFMRNGSYGFHATADPALRERPRLSPEIRAMAYTMDLEAPSN